MKGKVQIPNSLGQLQVFSISELEEGIRVESFWSDEVERVEIPEKIEGKPVRVLGIGAFFFRNKMKSIHLPGTLEIIEKGAFSKCEQLEEVILPDSVKELGEGVFRDCRGLKKVVFPARLKMLPISLFSFAYMKSPQILLPQELEVIKANAFFCAGSFDLVLPDSVKEIERGAFYMGPNPITGLPLQERWFATWPYEEIVVRADTGERGRITDWERLENDCRLYQVTGGERVWYVFYPCDFLDGDITFEDPDNQRFLLRQIRDCFRREADVLATYQVRRAYQRGRVRSFWRP